MAGHQRTADTPAGGGRADTPAGGGQAGVILRMGIHHTSCLRLRYGGREDTEGAPTRRQGRFTNNRRTEDTRGDRERNQNDRRAHGGCKRHQQDRRDITGGSERRKAISVPLIQGGPASAAGSEEAN
jgi:hypothetical protein